MDYKKIYDNIIQKAKNRQLESYKEKHHIIPKCLGGNDNKDNLVELTAKEHFLCHMLLCRIYPDNIKLLYALFLMSIGRNKKPHSKYKLSSRTYERIKQEWHEKVKHKPKPPGFGDRLKNTERNKKIGLANKKSKPPGFGNMMSELNKGKKRSKKFVEEHIKRKYKPILQYDKDGNFIKEWDSATTAGKELKINKSQISAVARGIEGKKSNSKSAGGFIWKYKNTNEKN